MITGLFLFFALWQETCYHRDDKLFFKEMKNPEVSPA